MTAAARPHLHWVGEEPETRRTVRAWPVGPALGETLATVNSEVHEALQVERTRLREHGYPDDLPLPALWWTSRGAAPEQD